MKNAQQRQQEQIEEIKKEKQALEAIIEQSRQDKSATSNLYFEKDSEIEFLQKEISNLMKEKTDKDLIIKSKSLSLSSVVLLNSYTFHQFNLLVFRSYLRELEVSQPMLGVRD